MVLVENIYQLVYLMTLPWSKSVEIQDAACGASVILCQLKVVKPTDKTKQINKLNNIPLSQLLGTSNVQELVNP